MACRIEGKAEDSGIGRQKTTLACEILVAVRNHILLRDLPQDNSDLLKSSCYSPQESNARERTSAWASLVPIPWSGRVQGFKSVAIGSKKIPQRNTETFFFFF